MSVVVIETYFAERGWYCRRSGDETPFHISDTKELAIRAGRDEAKRLEIEHVVKNEDGQIESRDTYSRDHRNSAY